MEDVRRLAPRVRLQSDWTPEKDGTNRGWQKRAVATYNCSDFEAIVREYAAVGREHHGLIIIHPTRFPSWEVTRLVRALATLIDNFPIGGSFVTWLQEPPRR